MRSTEVQPCYSDQDFEKKVHPCEGIQIPRGVQCIQILCWSVLDHPNMVHCIDFCGFIDHSGIDSREEKDLVKKKKKFARRIDVDFSIFFAFTIIYLEEVTEQRTGMNNKL